MSANEYSFSFQKLLSRCFNMHIKSAKLEKSRDANRLRGVYSSPSVQLASTNRNGLVVTLRIILELLGLVIVVMSGRCAENPEPAGSKGGDNQLYDVRRFLAEGPPLKKMLFTYTTTQVEKNTRRASERVHLAEAAWQTNTFFVSKDTGGLQVVGRTCNGELWYVD